VKVRESDLPLAHLALQRPAAVLMTVKRRGGRCPGRERGHGAGLVEKREVARRVVDARGHQRADVRHIGAGTERAVPTSRRITPPPLLEMGARLLQETNFIELMTSDR